VRRRCREPQRPQWAEEIAVSAESSELGGIGGGGSRRGRGGGGLHQAGCKFFNLLGHGPEPADEGVDAFLERGGEEVLSVQLDHYHLDAHQHHPAALQGFGPRVGVLGHLEHTMGINRSHGRQKHTLDQVSLLLASTK
jgi:hypothetical protein